MTISSEDSTLELGLPAALSPDAAMEPGELVIYLFDELQSRLLSYTLAFGLSIHDAEDVLQETFLLLFAHLRLDRSRSNLRGWLFRVAHNLALKKRRSAHRASAAHVGYDEVAARHPDPAPSAEELVEFRQRQKRFLSVLDALPEQDRQCLILRAEGLKYREIAKIVGISLGSVSLSLSRSLARLARSAER